MITNKFGPKNWTSCIADVPVYPTILATLKPVVSPKIRQISNLKIVWIFDFNHRWPNLRKSVDSEADSRYPYSICTKSVKIVVWIFSINL